MPLLAICHTESCLDEKSPDNNINEGFLSGSRYFVDVVLSCFHICKNPELMMLGQKGKLFLREKMYLTKRHYRVLFDHPQVIIIENA